MDRNMRKGTSLALLIWALCLDSQTFARPPSTPQPLAGLKVIAFDVVRSTEASRACDIAHGVVESAAKSVLRQSRLKVVPPDSDSGEGFMIINAGAIPMRSGQCVLIVEIAVRAPGTLDSLFGKSSGVYTLWTDLNVHVLAREDVPRELEKSVRLLTSEFLKDWTKQNSKTPSR